MKHLIYTLLLLFTSTGVSAQEMAQMEKLDRAPVALPSSSGRGIFPIGRALTSLTLLFVGGLLITALLTGLVIDRLDTIPALQISIIAQNVLTFAMPAVVAVCIYTAKPWRFLAIDRRPPVVDIALMTAVYVASIPLVNYLVALNEAIALPECLSGIEQALKNAEESA